MWLNDATVLTWGVFSVLMLAALLLARPAIRFRLQRRREEKLIDSLAAEQIRDVIIDDGMEGTVVLERLLLMPEGLLVVMTLRREGILFGGERIDTWSQVVGKRTIRFPNPLYTLETLLAAVRYHVPGITVQAKVLFLGNCTFPKGQPDKAWTLSDIPQREGKPIQSNIVPVLQEGWNKLKAHAQPVNRKTQSHLLADDNVCRHRSAPWAVLTLLLALGWLAWRLVGF